MASLHGRPHNGFPAHDNGAMDVRDVPERGRFELVESVEGGATSVVGFADYEVRGNVAVMPHTVISSDRRGHGLGDVLVGAAVQELRGRGLTIDPVCWFVADYLERHPSQH